MRDWHQEENASLEDDNIELVRSEGMTVIEDADIAAFKAATADAVREYADTVWGAGVYDQVLEANPEG
jgi:TRAP-type C4-dicarboxylate transport system substrate-binding protein